MRPAAFDQSRNIDGVGFPVTQRRRYFDQLKAAGIRASLDDASEKIGAKIRSAQLEKIPYMLVIGAREAEEGTVSVRHRDLDDLGALPLETFLSNITAEIQTRSLTPCSA